MPSLRQKVTTYFRQLSFINEPREGSRSNLNSNNIYNVGNFMTKYLEGKYERTFIAPGPDVISSQELNLLPELPIAPYPKGSNTITAACTGPDEGLTGIKRSKLHLSAGSDIDFIDTNLEQDVEIRKSISHKFKSQGSQKFRSDQNANKTITTNTTTNIGSRSRKNSRSGSLNYGIDSSISQSVDQQLQKIKNSETKTTVQINSNNTNEKSINDNYKERINSSNNATTLPTTIIVSMISTKNSPKTELKCKSTKPINLNEIDNMKKNIEEGIDTKTTSEDTKTDNTILCIDDNNLANIASDDSGVGGVVNDINDTDPIASVTNWKMETDHAYGISVSLYEHNMLTKESMGNPIADCYGLVARGNVAAMAMADGVNWGDGARLAARSAVHGSLNYLDTAIFGLTQDCSAISTRDVFVSLLRSLWEGHDCILEVGGALSTLTVAVILPLSGQYQGKYIVCACNVGDSLGYVYSKKYGIREFTQGSHDITSMRDMRDALGALGPVDGNKPELTNLTLSMTVVESGDIVFLTSDGISDNFDPVVGKFAEAWTSETKIRNGQEQQNMSKTQLVSKRQNKTKPIKSINQAHSAPGSTTHQNKVQSNKPPCTPNPVTPSSSKPTSFSSNVPIRPKYMRSHTVIEPRVSGNAKDQRINKYPCSPTGLPLVTGPQRHTLTLLRIEDLLSYGINGQLCPCASARKLCHLLVDFVRMITSARRKTLEQRELFYKIVTGPDVVKREVQMNRLQHRSARKRVVDTNAFSILPGKLDHASIVAYTIGSGLHTKEFQETNF